MVETRDISLSTNGNGDIRDITGHLSSVLEDSKIQSGTVTIFCPSATSGLTTIEYESGCVQDLQRLFDEIVPEGKHYAHNARWGDGNGHSHVRAALLGPSISIPFIDRQMTLGTWQQVIFIDFDNRARTRKLIVQIMGD